ncbi:MAG: hypothetical protein HYR96_05885 [Deltaproteobacteria bacterium]|nr:hypothetical protein [Deltaproteobacteria bacterium]MBI3295786.1 hypothetical protein [Deltaproteobacteria bacterium]
MKTTLITSLFAVASQMAFAFPGLDILQPQLLKQSRGRASHSDAKPDAGCADFSGKWKGSCKVSETSIDLSLEIKQTGCTMLQAGGDITPIGGLKADSFILPIEGGKNVAVFGASSSDWNADQSELGIQFNALVKEVGTQKTTPLSGSGNLKLEGGRLVETMGIGPINVSCIFDKE